MGVITENKVRDKGNLCDCLIHPFQDDPGVSQQQREMEELMGDRSKIDARKTADLLDFFYQLSMQINYHDNNLLISDWRPFFEKSVPFILASVIRHKANRIRKQFEKHCQAFERNPGREGLQLAQLFLYYNTLKPVAGWYAGIKGSQLPVERVFENIIKDKIARPLTGFISLNLLSANKFSIKAIDFNKGFQDDIWGLRDSQEIPKQLKSDREKITGVQDCELLLLLHKQTKELFHTFFGQLSMLGRAAEQSLELSFIPLGEEMKQKHLPHLALLFAFLKLFQKLQGQLNGFTKKHLDYFYKEVLKLAPRDAMADKAHLVFAIQKELDNYRIEKGVEVRDGLDANKEDILFALDEEIVVNQAQVKEVRTLHVNNLLLPAQASKSEAKDLEALVEGVYMASDATKSDGIDKDFQTEVKNFYTLGHKDSKYILPETKVVKPYESARLGFILASPVLLLEGGTREVNIVLDCIRDAQVCKSLTEAENPASSKCCEQPVEPGKILRQLVTRPVFPIKDILKKNPSIFVPRLAVNKLAPIVADIGRMDVLERQAVESQISEEGSYDDFSAVNDLINLEYYYISQDLIAAALKKGLSNEISKVLKSFLQTSNEEKDVTKDRSYCYCPLIQESFDAAIAAGIFEGKVDPTLEIIKEFFPKRKPFSLSFSGEKSWVSPTSVEFKIERDGDDNKFKFKISATLDAEKDPVVFYDKEKLGEDFNVIFPLAKIVLDDHIKLAFPYKNKKKDTCCLQRGLEDGVIPFSLYHFFREVRVLDTTQIKVKVCDLKKLVVQNDESIMDVNSPILPFGSRPDIASFSVLTNPSGNCITPTLIYEAGKELSDDTITYLNNLLEGTNSYSIKKDKVDEFLSKPPGGYKFKDQEKIVLKNLLENPLKNYCLKNAGGPSFYIGSNEVWRKAWVDAAVNIQWKDKPNDFAEYYMAYYVDPRDSGVFGLKEEDFRMNLGVLRQGNWVNEKKHPPPPPNNVDTIPFNEYNNRPLFRDDSEYIDYCNKNQGGIQRVYLKNDFFSISPQQFTVKNEKLTSLTVDTRDGFIRMNLQNQDFLHKDYSFVLARQMVAFGKLPNDHVEGAVYYDDNKKGPIVISTSVMYDMLKDAAWIAADVKGDVGRVKSAADSSAQGEAIDSENADSIRDALTNPPAYTPLKEQTGINLEEGANTIDKTFNDEDVGVIKKLDRIKKYAAIIPNEPWTPAISGISIDYRAKATADDIYLIHVYPFKDTHKEEQIKSKPTLLPSFCHEGNLYLGLEKLVPGTNLNIFFQLAEATSDAEQDKEDVFWYYLDNNIWKALRPGFEVVEDNTHNLTTTGIIKFALPENMTNTNTVMPAGLHWIRASIPKNSRSVSETTAIYTQAVKATFTNTPANDKLRLGKPIGKEQLTKLEVADASVKQVKQPFETFGGQVPEEQGLFYVRVSEMLRHKGRGIQKFDYERIVLNAFPELYRAKCINHSFGLNANLYKNDFPYAPGYILMAVIPDLTKMDAGNSYEPKAPASLLERIEEYVRGRISPFVRFRAMNPRYEKVNLCLKVKLVKGRDEIYYKERLKDDLRQFLAPWTVGDQYLFKLAFGACVNRSTIIGFIESLEYIDFIGELRIRHESEEFYADNSADIVQVCPKTPRSILVGGNIEICIIEDYCEEWEKCTDSDPSKCCDKKEPVSLICKPVEPPGKGVIL